MSRKSEAAKREHRRKQVAANLLAGVNYRDIADALGVSLGTISNDVKIIMGRWQREQVETAEDYVTLMEQRLDRALNAIWADVLNGNPKAIDRMLKIEDRRAKLRGLDQPVEVRHSGAIESGHTNPLEGLDADARNKLIDNLIRARRVTANARRDDAGHGADGGGASS